MTSTISAPTTTGAGKREDYHALNAELNIFGPDSTIQFDKDRAAARQFFLQKIIPATKRFDSVLDRLD
ncbi:hypothetical protein, partial [Actinotignum schaalii]